MKRQRDYKAEYQQRNERAKLKGYSGYSSQRTVYHKMKVAGEKIAERLTEGDLASLFEAEDIDELLDYDDSIFWEAFRNYYGKGTTA